jgi:hypothetical protein
MHWRGDPNEPWPGEDQPERKNASPPPTIRKGRTPGTGYQALDQKFVRAARELQKSGQAKSANEAAMMIVKMHEKEIVGSSFHTKKERIRKAVKALERNGG